MKKLLLNPILLFLAISLHGQTFVIISPLGFQYGIMQHQNINDKTGIFGQIRNGYIDFTNFHTNMFKTGIGISHNIGNDFYLLLGINYYRSHNVKDNNPAINLNRMFVYSVDVGWIAKLPHRFYVCALTDPLNWETEFGVGYKLKI